jgi:hypothetical protein
MLGPTCIFLGQPNTFLARVRRRRGRRPEPAPAPPRDPNPQELFLGPKKCSLWNSLYKILGPGNIPGGRNRARRHELFDETLLRALLEAALGDPP